MNKMHQLLVTGALAVVCCLLAAEAATTSSKFDHRGRYNPHYNDPYYDGRYLRNREYHQSRRYYDNFFKRFDPRVAAAAARIVDQRAEPQHEGTYAYSYETENGIHGEERGRAVPVVGQEQPAEVVEGSYAFVTPEGVHVGVKYTADQTGFHPVITYDGVDAEHFSRQQQPADVVITRIH